MAKAREEAPKYVEAALDTNPKTAFGMKKPPLGLVPSTAIVYLSMAMGLGAAKYGPYNWRDEKVSSMVYINAAERHLRSWLDGEDTDPESGVSHIAHVMACCAIILDAETVGNLIDNRPPKANTAELIRKLTEKN